MTPQQEWARCRPWIEAAIATGPGLQTIEDVEQRVAQGIYQVWFGDDCCVVTAVEEHDQGKVLNVVHGGGDLAELLDRLEPAMCDYARAQGCTMIMGMGRKGWERVTEKRGYRFGWVVMVKDLVQ